MTANEILTGAKTLIATKGWTPGQVWAGQVSVSPIDPNADRFSATAAITRAWADLAGPGWDGLNATLPVLRVAEAKLSVAVGDGAQQWNDAPGRTKEEVLAGFDLALA